MRTCGDDVTLLYIQHNISIILGEIEYKRDNIAVVKIMFAELNYDYMEEIVMYNGWDFIGKHYLISKIFFVQVRLLVRID